MTAPFIPQPQQPGLPPGIQYTQQPGYAPPPAYPQQQPQYQQPYIPPQQQPQQQPYIPQGLDQNARLSGPGIPQELQGKTVGEALRYYGIMREDFVRRNQPQFQPQQQPQPQYQQPQQQPQYQQPQQQPGQPSAQPRGPQQQGQPVDPMQRMVEDTIRSVMPAMLEPLVRPVQQGQVEKAFNDTRTKFAQDPMMPFDRVAVEVAQSLQGANPQTLADPAVWEAAYYHAKGMALSRPQQGQGQPQYQQPGPQYPQQQPGPVFQQVQPAFVEGPTPPAPMMGSGANGYGGSTDPRDELFARRFGVPVEVYRSWRGQQGQNQAPIGFMPRQNPGIAPQNAFGGPPNQQPQQQQPQYQPQYQQPQLQPYQPPVPAGYYNPSQNGVGYGF